jgi:SAM-dependent methyltransferase
VSLRRTAAVSRGHRRQSPPFSTFDDVVPASPQSGSSAARDPAASRGHFLAAVREAVAARTLASLVLSGNRRAGADLESVRVRLIGLRGKTALSFVWRYATRDVTKNLDPEAGLAALAAALDPAADPSFAHATLRAGDRVLELLTSRKGRQTLTSAASAAAASEAAAEDAAPLPAHDRAKRRALPLDLPFLAGLGLTDAEHRLVPAMARKWKQIDKFLEVLDHALDAAGVAADATLRVVDFGCGKGYLTFAVHEHLRRRFGRAPQVTGVELRADLVALCNRVAARAGCEGLSFVEGDLRSFVPQAVDVMIALHACDTATDHAIDLGLRAGARILVCSPCCHKELRPQMARPGPLAGMLRYGIHLGQEAEMVTDSLRALLLEAAGYEASVFEFVSLEHTSKNKMILAIRRGAGGDAARALAQVDDIKAFYGIREQCLERLVRARAEARLTSTEGS